MSYPLYHTLDKNLKKSDLSAVQKKALLEKLSNATNDEKSALIMLIAEHSKVADEVPIDPENFNLPYGVQQIGKDVHIDLENLPIPLRWILWKFMNLNSPAKVQKL